MYLSLLSKVDLINCMIIVQGTKQYSLLCVQFFFWNMHDKTWYFINISKCMLTKWMLHSYKWLLSHRFLYFKLSFSIVFIVYWYSKKKKMKTVVCSSLSETRRGWRFLLTPLPSLRSKAHKVIREILPYIRAQFAFKLGHANFSTCINC